MSEWLERASDLLAEPDPGPTPFVVEGLLTESCIGAIQGTPKVGKTWVALELASAIATGRSALGSFAVPESGPPSWSSWRSPGGPRFAAVWTCSRAAPG